MSQHAYNTTTTYPTNNTKRNVLIALIAVVIGTILVVSALFLMNGSSPSPAGLRLSPVDSGVSECKQIAKNAASNTNEDTSKAMTKAELAAKEKPFLMSKYNDIRVAGVGMITTIYLLDNEGDDATSDLGTSMVTLTTVMTKYAMLQQACGAHGVTLPDLNS